MAMPDGSAKGPAAPPPPLPSQAPAAPTPWLHARVTFWTTLIVVLATLGAAPLYIAFPDVLRGPETTYEYIRNALIWPLMVLPFTVKVWGGGLIAWVMYATLLRHAAAPLRRASLFAVNLFAIGLVGTTALILMYPQPFEAAVFLWSMDGLLPVSYDRDHRGLQHLDWITNAPLLGFFALCGLAAVRRSRTGSSAERNRSA